MGTQDTYLVSVCIFLYKGGKCMQNKVITKLNDLNLIDRFLFSETMENRDAYQAAVSILLEKEIPTATPTEERIYKDTIR